MIRPFRRQFVAGVFATAIALALVAPGGSTAARQTPAVAEPDGAAPPPRVREIHFDRQPILRKQDKDRVPWLPLGLVDFLHIDTRTAVIRRSLVLQEGDLADVLGLEESERKLRATGFLRDVRIEQVPVADGVVDLVVHTREAWTTSLDVSYERFEQATLWSARLQEDNFGGTGRALTVSRSEDLDRRTWAFGLVDPLLFNGRWRVSAEYADSDDGPRTSWFFGRPFFSLKSTWSGTVRYSHSGARPRYYVGDARFVRPHADFNDAQFLLQRRLDLPGHRASVWRVGLGVALRDQRFAPEIELEIQDPDGTVDESFSFGESVPEGRRMRSIFLGFERRPILYKRHRFLNLMGRVEDVPQGFEYQMRAGWITRALGSDISGANTELVVGWRQSYGSQVTQVSMLGQSLLLAEGVRDLRASLVATQHVFVARDWRLAGALVLGTGSRLDRHRPFLLGVERGLRGARFQEQVGDRLVRGNIEVRWVHSPGILGIVTPGINAFADVGTAWWSSEDDLRLRNLRAAVGVGGRIGMSLSAVTIPIRLDLAWPLLYGEDRTAPVVSIGTGQVF